MACRVQQPILLGSREIPSLCAQRLASSLVDSTSPRPIRSSAVASQTLRRGRPVLGRGRTGREKPRRREGSAEAKHLRSARLRQANWYATGSVSASEAVQISANRGECVCIELNRNNGQLWRPLAINGRRSANVASSRARRPSDSATETGQLVGLRIRRALMPHAIQRRLASHDRSLFASLSPR